MNQGEFFTRAKDLLDLKYFNEDIKPVVMGTSDAHCPEDKQYILRMMVRSPESDGFQIPEELNWLRHTIESLDNFQKENQLNNPYVYVTVRHGLVSSETDDEWHVDGFSMRVPRVPEQNYICSSVSPTEFVSQPIRIPDDFDPFIHNLHHFLQDNITATPYSGEENRIYLIDPYCIHRRPTTTKGQLRTFWRISFIPIEIEDDTCNQNPLMPEKTYNRTDIRNQLVRYGN